MPNPTIQTLFQPNIQITIPKQCLQFLTNKPVQIKYWKSLKYWH